MVGARHSLLGALEVVRESAREVYKGEVEEDTHSTTAKHIYYCSKMKARAIQRDTGCLIQFARLLRLSHWIRVVRESGHQHPATASRVMLFHQQ